jgi:HD superfamily phosphohydrolase
MNRLHNVIQNSTAFRVYPSLKYSRFAHSIGTMHVATNIFSNIILNSNLSVPGSISTKGSVKKESAEKIKCKRLLENESKKALSSIRKSQPELLSILKERIPFSNGLQKHSVLFAAIRIAALLHDIGHMPYSHVYEFALHQLFNSFKCDEKQKNSKKHECDNGGAGAARHLCFLVNCSESSKYGIPNDKTVHVSQKNRGQKKIHELLGKSFIQLLIDSLVSEYSQMEANPVELIKIADEILYSQEYPICSSLLTGTVESDRIDFIRRDGEVSGLFKSSVDYGRLFSFYDLEIEKGRVRAFPSIRAKSESEKLIWERFMVYKYIASHHKVHLYDELLERFIYLSITSNVFDEQIDSLCKLISRSNERDKDKDRDKDNKKTTKKPAKKTHYEQKQEQGVYTKLVDDLLTGFDDPWLEFALRDAYKAANTREDSKKTGRKKNTQHKIEENQKKRHIFEAINERRDLFTPMCKTDEDFQYHFGEVIKQFIEKNETKTTTLEAIDFLLLHINHNKYQWEMEFTTTHNIGIILGDISHKLNIGIKTEDAIELSDLNKFLIDKKISSTLFNIWFSVEDVDKHDKSEEIRKDIVEFVKNKINELSQLHQQKIKKVNGKEPNKEAK